MHIVLDLERHVVIDNELHLFDVEPTRGYICRNQDRALPPFLELSENRVSLRLRLVTVNALHAVDIFLLDLFHKLVYTYLRLAEHDDARLAARALDLSQKLDEFDILFFILHHENFLLDFSVGTDFRVSNLDPDRSRNVAAMRLSQCLDFLWPGGTEHEGLSIWSDMADDLLKLSFKTHVQHAVCFVEHQICYSPHIGDICIHKIDKSTWRRDQDFNATFELFLLLSSWNTTITGACLNLAADCKLITLCLNLTAKFPGWSQD